jgi:hypothetical protein
LKNGEGLDADALPDPLDIPELRRAMEVLKMFAQNDLERELYEGRLKAKRDLQTLETFRKQLEAERDTLATERDAARREARDSLVKRIQLCEQLLGRSVSARDDLVACDMEQLRRLAEELERQLVRSK